MGGETKSAGFAAVFFTEDKSKYATYLSCPVPCWLDGRDMTRVVISESGMYCVFFLMLSEPGGRAYMTVNGRRVEGSERHEQNGEITGSAVCSIRERALPCAISIDAPCRTDGGVLLVAKFNV